MDTSGPARRNGGKRYRSASLENSGPESTSCRVKLESPERAITGADDSLLKETKLCIGRFFYENGLDFSAVDSASFHSMISLFSRRGPKYQVPTVEELKGWIFNDLMKEMHEYVDGVKKSWSETGCSILLDGWKDANGRRLVNVLVDCPKGTVYLRSYDISDCVKNLDKMQSFFVSVLAEVGIENVVQIITYSCSSFMREAGKQLMERYRPIFWTVSASYCIELMLEKIREMDEIGKTLEKAKTIARFVHSHPIALKHLRLQSNGSGLIDSSKRMSIRPFLAVENIVMGKETLVNFFLSTDPQALILTSESEGTEVANLLADCSFWSGASTVLKGAIPLVRVIEWISDSDKDLMGNIYETIDQAKETIKDEFNNKASSYTPFWKVIDEVWNEFLYSPLHSAGYYMNPKIFYSDDVFIDPEVVTGLLCCIVRSTSDLRVQDRITLQMEHYRISKGAMAEGIPEARRSISPVLWWSRYGGECPELQRLAIRVLSQTCDGGARFQLKRSLAEALLLGDGPNGGKESKDMVFLRYNMQLQNFVPGKTGDAVSEELNVANDWIEENGIRRLRRAQHSRRLDREHVEGPTVAPAMGFIYV